MVNRKSTEKWNRGFWFRLTERGGEFSLSAFWFSAAMAVSLLLVIAVTLRYLWAPGAELVAGLPGIAAVLALPNAILAGAYTWGKKIDGQS
ncbi:MAG TPA: hypothetical protein VM658_12320 [bacterium]|nr:hypothetical protein [bacterium]